MKKLSQIFLEECKYAIKKKEIINSVNEELNLHKSDEYAAAAADDDDDDDDESNKSDEDLDCIL